MIKNRRLVTNLYGDLKNIRIQNFDIPKVKSNEVLIEVHCAGVSFADILAYEGNYQDNPDLPFVAGLEVSGVIKSIGSKVTSFKEGQSVIALSKWGGFSEFIAVDESFVLNKSEHIPHDIGSSMIINYGTSFYTIVERLKCKKGDKILILGASGGIGIAAIEISKAIGCEVIAVASSHEKLKECKKYGADVLILKERGVSLKEILKKNLDYKVDVIIDSIGGQDTLDSLSFLSWEGSLVPMGFASNKIANIPANLILLKNISIVGVFWGPFAKGNKGFTLDSIHKINEFYENKLINISKPTLYSFEEYRLAFDAIKNRKSVGKLSIYTSKYDMDKN